MAVGDTGYSSAEPRQYDPSYVLSTAPLRTWGTTGNTDTVNDATCTPGCFVDWMPISPTAGFWKVVASQGSFIVTSTDSESAGIQYYYRIRS